MNTFIGLDVSLASTAACVIDERGKILKEAKVDSEPEALIAFLRGQAPHGSRPRGRADAEAERKNASLMLFHLQALEIWMGLRMSLSGSHPRRPLS